MKVEFLKKFSKDLDAVKSKHVRQSVIRLIELMETVDALDKIPNTVYSGDVDPCVPGQADPSARSMLVEV
jgi:hypothetical protein